MTPHQTTGPCGCTAYSVDQSTARRAYVDPDRCCLPDLIEASGKLANEAAGFLALSDIDRHGMTNSRILRDRIEEVRAAIAKATPSDQRRTR